MLTPTTETKGQVNFSLDILLYFQFEMFYHKLVNSLVDETRKIRVWQLSYSVVPSYCLENCTSEVFCIT